MKTVIWSGGLDWKRADIPSVKKQKGKSGITSTLLCEEIERNIHWNPCVNQGSVNGKAGVNGMERTDCIRKKTDIPNLYVCKPDHGACAAGVA